jgi:hypothetical protein
MVDLQNALDRHQRALNDAKVASRSPYNRSQSLLSGSSGFAMTNPLPHGKRANNTISPEYILSLE